MSEVQAKYDDLKKYDPTTAQHCLEISALAVQVAKSLNDPNIDVEQLQVGAVLHDLGKIGVPLSILQNETPLSDREWTQIKQHPQMGHDLLGPALRSFETIAACVLFHHERPNGEGYPHGLKANEIPMAAQIIGVVDIFDAMISERPNNPALTNDEALNKLSQMAVNGIVNSSIVDALYDTFGQTRQ